MKTVILALSLIFQCFGGYTYKRSITINHTKIPNTDQSNFPVGFVGTYSYLAGIANGGNVTNTNGYDIIFTSDSSGTTPLPCEQESYNSATGAVAYWVKIPTLSHTADTVIYLFYGNGSVSTSQCAGTTVWNSNFSLVQHYAGTGPSVSDSTSNANSVTNHGITATSTNCVADGCGQFSSAYATMPSSSSLLLGTNMTLEIWFDRTGLTTTSQVWFDKRLNSGGHGYLVALNYNPTYVQTNFEVYLSGTTTSCDTYAVSLTIPAGSSHYVATYDGSTIKAWFNGSQLGFTQGCSASTAVGSTNDSSASLYVGSRFDLIYPLSGPVDEVRISNVARSGDWITTTYNNISSPSSFYTIGSPVSPASPNLLLPIQFR
jgi:hypothetical protein